MSKFFNQLKVYRGEVYDSKKEADYARDLYFLKLAGEIKKVSRQVKFKVNIKSHHICNYIADFVVTTKKGIKEIHEVKGFKTKDFKLKWKLIEAIYGSKYKMILI